MLGDENGLGVLKKLQVSVMFCGTREGEVGVGPGVAG